MIEGGAGKKGGEGERKVALGIAPEHRRIPVSVINPINGAN